MPTPTASPAPTTNGGPDKNPSGKGSGATGAIIGVVVCVVIVLVLVVIFFVYRRRKLRNSYGRLNEDTEDSGWSAFSKNPIYRGDRDYSPL
jgi:hypothetical protein